MGILFYVHFKGSAEGEFRGLILIIEIENEQNLTSNFQWMFHSVFLEYKFILGTSHYFWLHLKSP